MKEPYLFRTPNLRKLFRPEHDHILISCDLAGADAQVVAWEADDEELKSAFRAGWKIHAYNALALYGPDRAGEDGKREPLYTQVKRAVHATNYGATAGTISTVNGWSKTDSERFQAAWFQRHPPVLRWHERVWESLHTNCSVSNRFGYRITFFGRLDNHMFREALAWAPQATVAIVTDKGIVNVHKHMRPQVIPRLQVHDEGLYQVHRRYFPDILPDLRAQVHIPIPYSDPLTIQVGVKASYKSWGDCVPISWDPEEAEALLNGSTSQELDKVVHGLHATS